MNYIYSATTNSFYPLEMKEDYTQADSWPDDTVEVDEQVYIEFSGLPPEGKIRIAGENGFPAWSEIPPPTPEEQIAAAELEKQQLINQANDYMNSKQWPGKAAIGRLKGEELAQYNLWLDYLDALELVDTSSAPDIEWPTPPAVQAR
ncbi:tail fiber assembly protein [Escherichia coli]|nr:tail fiber assembly protein [Escherichia coli]EHK6675403.1 tail fiber assembly protein [Escherichia coli]EIH5377579.1 tail fiber assembly protein [Escherichia coli]EJE5779443.1 tail fiber assembly protein [Escherichia coli]